MIAYVNQAGEEGLFQGWCVGTLTEEPRGSGGFGYDPAFIPDEYEIAGGRTMAELTRGVTGASDGLGPGSAF